MLRDYRVIFLADGNANWDTRYGLGGAPHQEAHCQVRLPMAAFFCSELGDFVTGQTVVVNGGRAMN